MPPLSSPPKNPFDFKPRKPEEPSLDMAKISGMDQQTKNILLFAIIFSVLAGGLLLFLFFGGKGSDNIREGAATSLATSTDATATSTEEVPPAKKSFFSALSSLFKFSLPTTRSQTFAPSRTTSAPDTSSGARQTSGNQTGAQNQTTGSGSSGTAATATIPSHIPTKPLVGIYSELSSAEVQLDLEFFRIDIPSSPLRGKIWISGVRRSTKPDQEYLTLATNKELPSPTNITGMTIKSVVSGQIVQIGKGVGLPIANDVNTPTEIYITPGQKIIVTTGSSPLGYSLRLNTCTGYFEQFQNFTPGLPTSCPLLKSIPRPAPPNQLQDPCIDYVERFPKCTIITALPKATADALNQEQGYRCLTFIQNNTGYQNCVNRYMRDANFFGSEWRVFLNWKTPIWKTKREIIWLLDQEGRFVSQYSY